MDKVEPLLTCLFLIPALQASRIHSDRIFQYEHSFMNMTQCPIIKPFFEQILPCERRVVAMAGFSVKIPVQKAYMKVTRWLFHVSLNHSIPHMSLPVTKPIKHGRC